MWARDLRGAWVLARTELRATWRRIRGNTRQLLAMASAGVGFGLLVLMFAVEPAKALGRQLASGTVPAGSLGAITTAVAVGGLYMGGASALNQEQLGAVGSLVRTSLPPRAVTVGRFASELLGLAAFFGPPLLVGTALVGLGSGGPVAPLAVALVVVPALLAGILAGRAAGGGLRYAGALSRLSTWTKVILFLIVSAGIFVGFQLLFGTYMDEAASGMSLSVPALVPGTPMQSYAETLLAPLGGSPTPLGAGVVALVVVAIPGGLAIAARFETLALLEATDTGRTTESSNRTRAVPAPFARWPSTRMGWRQLVRTARDPRRFAHLFPLLFGLLGGGMSFVTEPESLFTIGPPAAVVLGAELAGVAYCLNPMGDDRDQLPLILTSADSTAVLLRGRAVAGSTLGLGLALALGPTLAVAGGRPVVGVGLALIAPLLVGSSAGIAIGLGSIVPKFERREYVNVERAHPSQLALIGYMFLGSAVFAIGPALVWFGAAGSLDLALVALGLGLYFAILGGFAYLGYVQAVGKFDALTLDDV